MLNRIFSSRKPKNKFSLENLKYLYGILLKNPVIKKDNKQTVVETLRAIAELMIWGDQHNANFFDFFCEKSILSHFVKILNQKGDQKVKVQVIQTLSILIQNTSSEMSVFYLLSNNYINDLIVHRFDFADEELLTYYISFLKSLSLKLTDRTILFFFNEHANDFPLYSEAIKFFNHPESMVRIAVRTLTLNVYKVDYPPMRRFILDRSAVPYFSNLVWFLRDQTVQLNDMVERSTYLQHSKLEEFVESQIDLLYYLQDILSLGIDALSQALCDQLLSFFVLPVLIGSLHHTVHLKRPLPPAPAPYVAPSVGATVAATTPPASSTTSSASGMAVSNENVPLIQPRLALFLLNQLFMTFTHYPFINSVATALLDPRPPVLADRLITHPPSLPVKAPVPLTTLLFPKLTTVSSSNSLVTVALASPPPSSSSLSLSSPPVTIPTVPPSPAIPPPLLPTSPPSPATVIASSTLPSPGAPPTIAAPAPPIVATPSSTSPSVTSEPFVLTNTTPPAAAAANAPSSSPLSSSSIPASDSKTERLGVKDIPPDENLKARSYVPEVPTVALVDLCPNYSDRLPSNVYRESLFACLSWDDERVVFGALAVIRSLMQNEAIDHELLVRADVCPQSHNKANRLLDELISTSDDPLTARTSRPQPTTTTIVEGVTKQRRSSSSSTGTAPGSISTTTRSRTNTGGNSSISTDDIIDDSSSAAISTPSNGRLSRRHSDYKDGSNGDGDGDDNDVVLTITPVIPSTINGYPVADERAITLDIALIPRRLATSRTTSTSSSSSLVHTPGGSPHHSHSAATAAAQFGPELLLSTWRRGASKSDGITSPGTIGASHKHNHSSGTTPLPHDMDNHSSGSSRASISSDLDTLGIAHGKGDDEHSIGDTLGDGTSGHASSSLQSHNSSHGDSPLLPPVGITNGHDKSSSSLLSPTGDPLLQRAGVASYHQRVPSNGSSGGNLSASSSFNTSALPSSTNNTASPTPNTTTSTSSGESKTVAMEVKAAEKAMFDTSTTPTYSAELVPILLSILKRQVTYRLVTTQLMMDVLSELVDHKESHPCLLPVHMAVIESSYRTASQDVRSRFDGPLGGIILDMFEDEWTEFHKPVYFRKMISDSLGLLPIESNPISGIPLNFRHASGDLERTRRAIQAFLVLRSLQYKMLKLQDRFPLNLAEDNVKREQEFEITPARLADTIPCTVAVGTKRVQLFLLMDPTALMLVQRHPERVGHAQVVMTVPLRHQEAFLNRNNVCVLHITIRSMTRPHASCRRLKQQTSAQPLPTAQPVVGGSASTQPMGGTGATGSTGPAGALAAAGPLGDLAGNASGMLLWNLTLLFGDRSQCAIAKRHLEQTRATIRTDLIANILRSFDDEQQLLLAHSGAARGRRASSFTNANHTATISSFIGSSSSSSTTNSSSSSSSSSSPSTAASIAAAAGGASSLPGPSSGGAAAAAAALGVNTSSPLLSPIPNTVTATTSGTNNSASVSPLLPSSASSPPSVGHQRQASKAPLMPSLRS